MSACRSCRAPIRWALTERGRRVPLDAEPYSGDDPRGLFVLRNRDQLVPTAVAVTAQAFPAEDVYRAHFATCPDGQAWRR